MEFINKLLDGQVEANKIGHRVVIYWRGYRCYVANNLPDMNDATLEMRLVQALKKSNDITEEEKEVNKFRHIINVKLEKILFFS